MLAQLATYGLVGVKTAASDLFWLRSSVALCIGLLDPTVGMPPSFSMSRMSAPGNQEIGSQRLVLGRVADILTGLVLEGEHWWIPLRGGQRLIVPTSQHKPNPDPVLIEALIKAHRMTKRERGQPLIEKAPISPYDRKILRLAFLAPDLQRDIIKGLQPPSLNLQKLQGMDIPLSWHEQREALGWARSASA